MPFGLNAGGGATKTPAAPVDEPTPVPPPVQATPTKQGQGLGLQGVVATPTPTQATSAAGVVLNNWASSQPADIISELRSLGLVPAGGTMMMTIPTSFGDTSASGFSYYPLGQGRNFGNLVLGFDAHLDLTGPSSGCGMHVRNNGASRISALVMEDGLAYLGEFTNGEESADSLYAEAPSAQPGEGAINRVTLVVVGNAAAMFINGQLYHSGTFNSQTGTVALEVLVLPDDAGNTARTYCQLDNIWLYEF
jgi:hypothetical protein